MRNPEFKKDIVPFPVDPNKFEINKWMRAMGLPVPEIYVTQRPLQPRPLFVKFIKVCKK